MYQAYGNTVLARRLVWTAVVGDALLLFFGLCATTFTNSPASVIVSYVLIAVGSVAVGWYAVKQGLVFEWLLDRKWRAVCRGLGGKFEAEVLDVRATARSHFGAGLTGHPLSGQDKTKKVYPKLREVRENAEGWTGIIWPNPGQTLDEYTMNAEAYTLQFDVPFMSFEAAGGGGIRVRAGRVQVPEPYSYEVPVVNSVNSENGVSHSTDYRGSSVLAAGGMALADHSTQPLNGSVLPAARAVSPQAVFEQSEADVRALLKAVPMAVDIKGRTWYMPIEGNHVLVAGRTGSGKGSWIYSLVFGLENACNVGLARLWAIDPKRVELALGRHRFYKYANDAAGVVGLIEEFLAEMQARGDDMEGRIRMFTPSVATPLEVLIIDELAYITKLLPDKKLRDRAAAALDTILTQGRAIGFAVFGAIQDPRKETLPNRDSYSIRVALGLAEKQLVDMVLGDGMHVAGAKAEQIPLGSAGAGCGYVISEEDAKPMLVRCAWCSDNAIKRKLGVPSDALVEVPGMGYPEYERGYTGAVVPQLDFDGKPLSQFRFRVE